MGIYSDFTTLDFDLSEIIVSASYLPVTPALPIISASSPSPLDYSIASELIMLVGFFLFSVLAKAPVGKF